MPVNRRDRATLVAVLCTAVAASWTAAAGVSAAPGTGGASVPEVILPTSGGTGYGAPGSQSIVVRPIAVYGREIVVRGTIPGAARRRLVVQWLDSGRGWRTVARGRVRSTDRFAVRWRPDHSGLVSLRAIVARRSRAAAGPPPIAKLTVYRPQLATFYGPGFFGRQTACGQVLTPEMYGVAHKRLPCGTPVAITYEGREIVVPVIDRGPFNGHYRWDLTLATADALGFTGAGEIGVTRVAPATGPQPS